MDATYSLWDGMVLLWAGVVLFAALCAAHLIASRALSRRVPTPARPTAPMRRHYALAAVLWTALAIYGSLVPLQARTLEWTKAVEEFRAIPMLQEGPGGRADLVANVLLFIPIGYLWSGTLLVDRPSRIAAAITLPLVVVGSAAASIALEFAQLWFPPRTVSQNDILAEAIGGLVGCSLWLVMGQTLTDWVRGFTIATRSKQKLDWLLEAYALGFIAYALLPLDLTLNVAELARKLRDGRVTLVPFTDVPLEAWSAYVLVRDLVLHVPVGMLLATWQTPPERPVRPWPVAAVLGLLFAACVEAAQILVISRFSSTTDVLVGAAGCGLGGWLMGRLVKSPAMIGTPVDSLAPWRQFALVLAGIAIYSLFLTAVFCAPFDLERDRTVLAERYRGFFVFPFARLYHGSEFNAVSEVLKKLLFFVPVGAPGAWAVCRLSLPSPIRTIFLAAYFLLGVAIGFAIEMLQIFFPPHYPDLTDVILYGFGILLGMLLMLQFARRSHP